MTARHGPIVLVADQGGLPLISVGEPMPSREPETEAGRALWDEIADSIGAGGGLHVTVEDILAIEAELRRSLAERLNDLPDITTVDWSGVERVDLLAGGFPCQPFSVAGKRAGTADDRWLWPEFARAVRDLRPRLVLVENVPGLLVGGGMDLVLGGLAELGYDTRWESVPAAAVGAPHLRYRVWIIAHRAELRWPVADADHRGPFDPFRAGRDAARNGGAALADCDGIGREGERCSGLSDLGHAPLGHDADRCGGQARNANGHEQATIVALRDRATAEPGGVREVPARAPDLADAPGAGWRASRDTDPGEAQGGRSFGWPRRPGWWATEPDVGRVAHGVPARVDRLRALGNAVVPQVVEVIGRRLRLLIEDVS